VMSRRLGRHDVQKALKGSRPLGALFTQEQRALLPAWVRIDDLAIFGPAEVRRAKMRPQGADFRLAVERWAYPDGPSILELSTRCTARAAVPTAAQLASVLGVYGIDLTGPQQTKTGMTLSHFSCAR
jgi:hypothetical protein